MTEQTMRDNKAPTEAGLVVETEAGPIEPIVRPVGSRVLSIDALRGFDMFWLMQEGTGLLLALAVALHLPLRDVLARELEHSEWLGFTFWDFIAPLFLFVVGLSMPFALSRRIAQGADRRALFRHVLKRTVVLIVLGLVFNGILRLDFAHFRYTGVLQRIALSYFFAAVIVLTCSIRGQAIWTDCFASCLLGDDGVHSSAGNRPWGLYSSGKSRRLY